MLARACRARLPGADALALLRELRCCTALSSSEGLAPAQPHRCIKCKLGGVWPQVEDLRKKVDTLRAKQVGGRQAKGKRLPWKRARPAGGHGDCLPEWARAVLSVRLLA